MVVEHPLNVFPFQKTDFLIMLIKKCIISNYSKSFENTKNEISHQDHPIQKMIHSYIVKYPFQTNLLAFRSPTKTNFATSLSVGVESEKYTNQSEFKTYLMKNSRSEIMPAAPIKLSVGLKTDFLSFHKAVFE